MKNRICQRWVMMLIITFGIVGSSAAQANGTAEENTAARAENGLPRVERGFNISKSWKAPQVAFAKMIPPESIQRIVLLEEGWINPTVKADFDPDSLFDRLVDSPNVCGIWGVDATERTVNKFLIMTEEGKVFKLASVSSEQDQQLGLITGVVVYGKGFSCRFDFRLSPLAFKKSDASRTTQARKVAGRDMSASAE